MIDFIWFPYSSFKWINLFLENAVEYQCQIEEVLCCLPIGFYLPDLVRLVLLDAYID